MADKPDQRPQGAQPPEQEKRFAFSTNRGEARHRLRYQEGSTPTPESRECIFCRH